MRLEQILRIATQIDSPAALHAARSQLKAELVVRDAAQCDDSFVRDLVQNAVKHLEANEHRVSMQLAVSQAFKSSTELCLVFENQRCLAATDGALNLLGLNSLPERATPPLEALACLANLSVSDSATWMAPNRERYQVHVLADKAMRILRLYPPKQRVTDDETSALLQGLTPQQARIVGLVGLGLANKEIAVHMGLSVHTVRAHLRALAKRLDVFGRVEALMAVRKGAQQL